MRAANICWSNCANNGASAYKLNVSASIDFRFRMVHVYFPNSCMCPRHGVHDQEYLAWFYSDLWWKTFWRSRLYTYLHIDEITPTKLPAPMAFSMIASYCNIIILLI